MDNIVKGFQTNEGTKQYDYNALANKPTLITQDQVDAALKAAKEYTDEKIKNIDVNDIVYVTVTSDENGKYTADKTVSELIEAYNGGHILICLAHMYEMVCHVPFLTTTEEEGASIIIFTADVGTRTLYVLMAEFDGNTNVACEIIEPEIPEVTMQNLTINIGEQSVTYNGTEQKTFNVASLKNPHPLTVNGVSYDGSEPVEINISGGGSGTTEKVLSDNLFDKSTAVLGKGFYHSSSGTQLINSTDNYAGYVELRGAGTYRTKVSESYHGEVYAQRVPLMKADKTWIQNIAGTITNTGDDTAWDLEFTVTQAMIDAGAAYYPITVNIKNIDTVMAVKDRDYPTQYIPYGYIEVEIDKDVANLLENALYKKTAVFLGDSICAGDIEGSEYDGYGWAGLIGETNDMVWKNYGRNGGTITPIESVVAQSRDLSSQVDLAKTDYPNADYVIFEGGTNDAYQLKETGLGIISDDFATFDTSTFSGAMESLILEILTAFPNAQVGYIVAQKMGNPPYTTANIQRKYFDRAIEICYKWGIPVIDLWNGSMLNPALAYHADNFYTDGQHLTLDGYKTITPMIEAWMRNLTVPGVVSGDGANGKSAYEYAQDAGYTGTEEDFAKKLADDTPTIDSGIVNELIDTKLRSVASYGAKGDGSTDDTAAFQNALANNRVVTVSGGTYKLSGELVIRDNCQLELSQDVVLNFTNTLGNCITLNRSAYLKGNHATVMVPYAFAGKVINADTSVHTNTKDVPPFTHWDPQWKTARYLIDLNICKANSYGLYESLNGDSNGTAVYIAADGDATSTFIWGLNFSGLRIAGSFEYGIRAVNFNDAYNNEMRIEALIDACKIGVSLEDCNNAYVSAIVQPRKANNGTAYAINGIQLIRCKNTDLSGSRVWDWSEENSLWSYDKTNVNQHISMYGNCMGTILNDYNYHYLPSGFNDLRELIYTDTPINFDSLIILQEPFTRWFHPVDREPYFNDGYKDKRLLLKEEFDGAFQTDMVPKFTNVLATASDGAGSVFNGIGYTTTGGWGSDGKTFNSSQWLSCTGYIPCKQGDILHVEGMSFAEGTDDCRVILYDVNFNKLNHINRGNIIGNASYFIGYTETEKGFDMLIKEPNEIAYITLTVYTRTLSSTPVISVNEEIKFAQEGFLADGIKIKSENVIGNVGGNDTNIPDYVRAEAERVAKVVQSRQNTNTITFLACSDIHYSSPYNTNPITTAQNVHDATLHMGQAMGLISSLVHIDFAAMMGDMIRDNEEVNKEEVQAEVRFVNSCLNEGFRGIPSFRLEGNHEEAYSSGVNLSIEEVFANVHAWNTNVTFGNRSIGYFYKDFEDVKLRVIFLNTSEGSGSNINVSAEQNTWLTEVLDLSEKDGNWCSVILSHQPLDFARSGGVDPIPAVNAATGLIGAFHGHIHNFLVDYINGTEVKRICIPNAVRDQEDSYGMNNGVNFSEGIKYRKTAGTAEDTAFCVVTIDLKARKIYADHYGAGYSREIDYTYKGAGAKYTNLVTTSIDPANGLAGFGDDNNGDGKPDGYKNGKYASGAGEGKDDACVLTGLIKYGSENTAPIYIKGADINTQNGRCRILGFAASLDVSFQSCAGSSIPTYFTIETPEDSGKDYYKLTPTNEFYTAPGFKDYLRFSLIGKGENLIITIDEPIE